VLELIYDSLLAFDKDMRIVPNIAEAWKWSDDGKALTMTLRQNVKFHNGDVLTSDDVVFSFQRLLDDKTGAAARPALLDIDKIDAPEALTVVFTMKKSNGAVLSAMASPNTAILSKKLVTNGADPSRQVNGTGPFKFSDWQVGKSVKLDAFRDYWMVGQPRLDGIEFRLFNDDAAILAALRARQVDLAIINDTRVAVSAGADKTLVTLRAPSLDYHVLQLNASLSVFSDVRVRSAISCAIDRQEVVVAASVEEGQITSPITAPPYRMTPSDLQCYKINLDKAKQWLTEAKANPRFKIMVPNDESLTALAEARNIQLQLARIGISVEIDALALNAYFDRWARGDFEAAIALNSGSAEPDAILYRYWHSTGSLNKVAGFKDVELDKLLDQARTLAEFSKRKELYDAVQRRLTDASPWVWLYTGYEYRVMVPSIRQFTPRSDGSLIFLREMWRDD
jgi:peptide/nickel transport system substrate-binding protein